MKVWADYERLDAVDLNANFAKLGARIGQVGYGVLTLGTNAATTPLKLTAVSAGDATLASLATGELVVPSTGIWLVTASVRGYGVPVGQLYRGNLRRNAVDEWRLAWSTNGGAAIGVGNSVAAVLPLNALDRLTLFATGASGYSGSIVDSFGMFLLVPPAS